MKFRTRASLILASQLCAILIVGVTLAEAEPTSRRPVAFVRRLTLIDAATKGPVTDLRDGMSIRLADVPENRLDIVAETYPRRVDRVTFKILEQGMTKSDEELPFTIGETGRRGSWRPKAGPATILVQPYQQGSPGIPLKMRVTFVGDKPETRASEPRVVEARKTESRIPPLAKSEPSAGGSTVARLTESESTESRSTESPTVLPLTPPAPAVSAAPKAADRPKEDYARARLAPSEPAPAEARVEPAPPVPQQDRCRAVLRPEINQLTVICSHSFTNATDAQLIVRGESEEGAVLSSEPLCQFENAESPIVTSCRYLPDQLERLQVRVRSTDGRERLIRVEFD